MGGGLRVELALCVCGRPFMLLVVLDLIVLTSKSKTKNSTFSAPSGPLAADEGGVRASDFSKPAALRGLGIAFGLTFTTPPGGRSPPFTRGRGAPLP